MPGKRPVNTQNPVSPVKTAIEIAIYLALLFALVAWCFEIIKPFFTVVLWAIIIAVACFNPFQALQSRMGGRRKLAATVFALCGLALIIVPVYLFADSLISGAAQIRTALNTGSAHIPPPDVSVKDWPMVGARLYEGWSKAAANLSEWLQANMEQIKPIVMGLAGRIVGLGVTALQFIASVLIAAAILATSTSLEAGVQRVAHRLNPREGHELLTLTTATIRSVTVGVLGIAFIQAVAGGAGMVVMGVPASGVWALIILILAIAQLPPVLVLLPAVVWVFSNNDNMLANVLFTVWSVLVSISDSFLKPLLLGRGVEAPMLVILLGAIGGMIQFGIIGLFIGAVMLALGYTLFQVWLSNAEPSSLEQAEDVQTGADSDS